MTKSSLDNLVRKILKEKESHCFTCGVHKNAATLEVGHFVPRRYLATRWDLRNCHLQCIECNRLKSGNLARYQELLGVETAQSLWAKARTQKKTDLNLVYKFLKKYTKKWYN